MIHLNLAKIRVNSTDQLTSDYSCFHVATSYSTFLSLGFGGVRGCAHPPPLLFGSETASVPSAKLGPETHRKAKLQRRLAEL